MQKGLQKYLLMGDCKELCKLNVLLIGTFSKIVDVKIGELYWMDRYPCGQGDNERQYGLPHENRRLLVSLLASPSHPSLSNE